MRWKVAEHQGSKVSDLIVSDLNYKILRCTRHGVPTGRYLAFLPRVGERPQLLGGFDSSDSAKKKCEEHAKAAA